MSKMGQYVLGLEEAGILPDFNDDDQLGEILDESRNRKECTKTKDQADTDPVRQDGDR
jgi:hypothetical protein|tara:strand:- start:385 stop:558 length:174 start_codon:yes stop_codon:yes gene_type:complete